MDIGLCRENLRGIFNFFCPMPFCAEVAKRHWIYEIFKRGGRWRRLGVRKRPRKSQNIKFSWLKLNLKIWVHFPRGMNQDYIFPSYTRDMACTAQGVCKRPAVAIRNLILCKQWLIDLLSELRLTWCNVGLPNDLVWLTLLFWKTFGPWTVT